MACKRSAVRFRLAPPFPKPQKSLPLTIYLIDKETMRFINRHKIAKQAGCAALMLALAGCAQMQDMGSYLVERVSGKAMTADNKAMTADNSAARAQSPQKATPAALHAQQIETLENEKRALTMDLQATAQATLLVQIDGGDITLKRAVDLPTCHTARAAISGMPGSEKQAAAPYRSAFSVGSVSPYTPHHLLISSCLPLAMVAPL